MVLNPRTRLHKLCSRALRETDPQNLDVLLIEINGILCETLDEIADLIKEVERVLGRHERLSGVHLVKLIQSPRLHEVGFYSDDEQFLDHLTQFVGTALKGGDAALLAATESHRDSLLLRLQAFGVDIGAAVQQGRYVALDGVDSLAIFMRNGMPDPARFMKMFGQVILTVKKATRAKHPRVAIFGECVQMLCAEGNAEAAIQVEKLCNELIKAHDVDILCGYFPLRIAGGMDSLISQRICEQHSAVHSF